jgi:hypothetical protein
MSSAMVRLVAVAFASALATPASAELLARKDLSLATALTIATTAAETCKAQGQRVSVTVVGRNGEVIVQLRGDNASPHTVENSFRKAYTSRTFRVPSGEIVKRLRDNPQLGAIHLTKRHRRPGRVADHGRHGRHRRGRGLRRRHDPRVARRRQGRRLRQGRHRQDRRPTQVSLALIAPELRNPA